MSLVSVSPRVQLLTKLKNDSNLQTQPSKLIVQLPTRLQFRIAALADSLSNFN